MKLICIGNSIVNGFPHTRDKSFSTYLNSHEGWDVENKGINGQSTDQILGRFDSDIIVAKPDYVLILTGANDFIFDINSPASAADNISKMISKATAAGISVFAASPLLTDVEKAGRCWMPDMNIDYINVNERLQQFAGLIEDLCRNSKAVYIDTQNAFKQCAEYTDGLHPTEEGQAFLGAFIQESIENTL